MKFSKKTSPPRASKSYFVDGNLYFSYGKPAPEHWITKDREKGFETIDRVTNRYLILLRCQACGELLVRPRNVVVDHRPEFPHCIASRRKAAAAKIGLEILRTDPMSKAHGFFLLSCGQNVRSQFHRVEQAAAGGHTLGCEICNDKELDQQSKAHGWTHLGLLCLEFINCIATTVNLNA